MMSPRTTISRRLTRPRPRAPRPRWRCFISLLILLIPACEKETLTILPGEQVSEDQYRRATQVEALKDAARQSEAPRRVRYRLMGQRVYYPLEAPRLDLVLSQLDPPDWNASTLRAWRDNGFGIAKISAEHASILFSNVPDRRAVDDFRIDLGDDFESLRALGPTTGRLDVSIDHGQRQHDLIKVRSWSEFRYLVRLDTPSAPETQNADSPNNAPLTSVTPTAPQDAAPSRLIFLPQYHKPKHTITPRLPQEKRLDGTLFWSMKVDAPLPTDQVWIIWYRSPTFSPADSTDPPLPRVGPFTSLGETLHLGERLNKPVQMVMLLTVQDTEAPANPSKSD